MPDDTCRQGYSKPASWLWSHFLHVGQGSEDIVTRDQKAVTYRKASSVFIICVYHISQTEGLPFLSFAVVGK